MARPTARVRCHKLSRLTVVSRERDVAGVVRYPPRAMSVDQSLELARRSGGGGAVPVDGGKVVEVEGSRLLGADLAPLPAGSRGRRRRHLHHRARARRRSSAGRSPPGSSATARTRSSRTASTSTRCSRSAPDEDLHGALPDAGRHRRVRGHDAAARRRRAARPRHVPADPLRRADLARSRRIRDVVRRLRRRPARLARGLLPRLRRHRRLAPDRDSDGVPGAALHHRRVGDRRARS